MQRILAWPGDAVRVVGYTARDDAGMGMHRPATGNTSGSIQKQSHREGGGPSFMGSSMYHTTTLGMARKSLRFLDYRSNNATGSTTERDTQFRTNGRARAVSRQAETGNYGQAEVQQVWPS